MAQLRRVAIVGGNRIPFARSRAHPRAAHWRMPGSSADSLRFSSSS